LNAFIGGSNNGNIRRGSVINYAVTDFVSWIEEISVRPTQLQTHSFGFMSHHMYNLSSELTDEYLLCAVRGAKSDLLNRLLRYLQSSPTLRNAMEGTATLDDEQVNLLAALLIDDFDLIRL
jgi:hypothetical protein